jgi:hypothetical protein
MYAPCSSAFGNTIWRSHNKCSFWEPMMAYLGHVILEQCVTMDAEKVVAVQVWSTSRTVHVVRGFLGLTGYYKKFAGPLTKLLKEGGIPLDT